MTEADGETLRRLRWQCRRGMLELDCLLLRFLDLGYADLDPAGRRAFTALLRQPDQDLSDWLIGRREPADTDFAALIVQIRDSASANRNRHATFFGTAPGSE